MRDHTDRATIRSVWASVSLALFVIIIWGPVNTLWIGPWIFEGTTLGSLEWRKAWVLNGWILGAPMVIVFGYIIFTVFRAIRKDEAERERDGRL